MTPHQRPRVGRRRDDGIRANPNATPCATPESTYHPLKSTRTRADGVTTHGGWPLRATRDSRSRLASDERRRQRREASAHQLLVLRVAVIVAARDSRPSAGATRPIGWPPRCRSIASGRLGARRPPRRSAAGLEPAVARAAATQAPDDARSSPATASSSCTCRCRVQRAHRDRLPPGVVRVGAAR